MNQQKGTKGVTKKPLIFLKKIAKLKFECLYSDKPKIVVSCTKHTRRSSDKNFFYQTHISRPVSEVTLEPITEQLLRSRPRIQFNSPLPQRQTIERGIQEKTAEANREPSELRFTNVFTHTNGSRTKQHLRENTTDAEKDRVIEDARRANTGLHLRENNGKVIENHSETPTKEGRQCSNLLRNRNIRTKTERLPKFRYRKRTRHGRTQPKLIKTPEKFTLIVRLNSRAPSEYRNAVKMLNAPENIEDILDSPDN